MALVGRSVDRIPDFIAGKYEKIVDNAPKVVPQLNERLARCTWTVGAVDPRRHVDRERITLDDWTWEFIVPRELEPNGLALRGYHAPIREIFRSPHLLGNQLLPPLSRIEVRDVGRDERATTIVDSQGYFEFAGAPDFFSDWWLERFIPEAFDEPLHVQLRVTQTAEVDDLIDHCQYSDEWLATVAEQPKPDGSPQKDIERGSSTYLDRIFPTTLAFLPRVALYEAAWRDRVREDVASRAQPGRGWDRTGLVAPTRDLLPNTSVTH